jgi:sterol desaturase/sphingolipid hydroxylase (fatty acid hydroxylase superfamily)
MAGIHRSSTLRLGSIQVSIHHEYALHRNNYGDIVWWDMMFGAYENPKEFKASCGFDDEKEQRLLEMVRFHDVHKS